MPKGGDEDESCVVERKDNDDGAEVRAGKGDDGDDDVE